MGFVEDLISKAFLSSKVETVASRGLLNETSDIEEPVAPPPPPRPPLLWAAGENLGFMLYGRTAPTIKLATTINGVEYKKTTVKNAGLEVNALVSNPKISVIVSNVNV